MLPTAHSDVDGDDRAHRAGGRAAADERDDRGEREQDGARAAQPCRGQAEQVLERAGRGEVGDAVGAGDGGVEEEGAAAAASGRGAGRVVSVMAVTVTARVHADPLPRG